jgi:hypothetical protein
MAGQRRDCGVVVAECAGGPGHRPGSQHHRPRRHVVSLAESRGRAQRFPAAPNPYQPSQQRDPAKAWCIVQHPDPPAVADRHYPTCRACRRQLTRLDGEHQPLLVVHLNAEDVHVGNVQDRIGPGAPARARTTHRVRHRRGFLSGSLVASDLEGPDASTDGSTRRSLGSVTHAQIRRAGNPRIRWVRGFLLFSVKICATT